MSHQTKSPRARLAHLGSVGLVALSLSGCATFSPDGGMSLAVSVADRDLGAKVTKIVDDADAVTTQAQVGELLRRQLDPRTAVQVALLKNRGLQASFNELGVSEAQYVKATLPPAPRIALARIVTSLELEIERQILVGLFELATTPARARVAEQRFRAAQFRTAEAVLRTGLEARRQYYRTVAANQQVNFLQQSLGTAAIASQMATQLGETGALNKLQQAREHAFYAEIGAQLARARIQQRVERERLIRVLGLWGPNVNFKLPGSLPPLPKRILPATDLERQALARRVDLMALRHDLSAVAAQFNLTRSTRFVTDIELAAISNFERTISSSRTEGGGVEIDREKVTRRGLEIEFEIPIYDFGESNVRLARETYMAAANRLAERAVNARSEVRETYQRMRGHYDLARYYQSRVLPLRKTIQDEALLHYSGMLADVTQLISDARARIMSNIDAINARRDFWIAATDSQAALVGGGGAGGGEAGTGAVAPQAGEAGPH